MDLFFSRKPACLDALPHGGGSALVVNGLLQLACDGMYYRTVRSHLHLLPHADSKIERKVHIGELDEAANPLRRDNVFAIGSTNYDTISDGFRTLAGVAVDVNEGYGAR